MKIEIVEGYVPGAIGRVAELHALYYHREWGFGQYFEAKVATELAAFLSRFDPQRDGFWTVGREGRVEGGIVIDGIGGRKDGAHLRWFILSDAMRGQGVGNALMRRAVAFCRQAGHRGVYLWTFEGLLAARHLYEKFGFRLATEHSGEQWGTRVKEQKFVCHL